MSDGDRPAPALPAVEAGRYRDVVGRFVTGVTVVTSLGGSDGSQPWGTTVNAFTSVSLEPPLVLVCIGRQRSIHPVIATAGRFAVNILAEESRELSDCFAGAPSALPREAFCGATWSPGRLGLPILDAAVAYLECELERVLDAGDHTVYLGRVRHLGVSDEQPLPLLYYRGRYLRIERAATTELRGKPDTGAPAEG